MRIIVVSYKSAMQYSTIRNVFIQALRIFLVSKGQPTHQRTHSVDIVHGHNLDHVASHITLYTYFVERLQIACNPITDAWQNDYGLFVIRLQNVCKNPVILTRLCLFRLWWTWLASTLRRFNANELRRADHEIHDITDGKYDGRIQKYQQGMSR